MNVLFTSQMVGNVESEGSDRLKAVASNVVD